jgi:hypothetical protein
MYGRIGTMKDDDMIEGPKAFERFNKLMKRVIQVPHSEIQKKVVKARAKAARNPNRPGPKPKAH